MKKPILIIAFVLLTFGKLVAQTNLTSISGNLSFLNAGDTVEITVSKYPEFLYANHLFEDHFIRTREHNFEFKFNCNEPFVYVSISFVNKSAEALENYIICQGSEVRISDANGNYQFTGKSGKDFEIQRNIPGIMYGSANNIKPHPGYLTEYSLALDSGALLAIQMIDLQKSNINQQLYRQLKANIIIEAEKGIYSTLYNSGIPKNDSTIADYQLARRSHFSDKSRSSETAVDEYDKVHSRSFPKLIFAKYIIDSCYLPEKPISEKNYLNFVKQYFKGELREKLSVYVVLTRIKRTKDDLKADLDVILQNLINPDFREPLLNVKENYYGTQIHDYSLTDARGKKVVISDFRGKVVVMDFYYTGCGNCLKIAPILREAEEHFKNKDVVFLSISIDKVKKTWLSSVKKELYSSPLSVNLYTSGLGTNDPIIKGLGVTGYPGLFLIDKNGRLVSNFNDSRMDNGRNLKSSIEKYLMK